MAKCSKCGTYARIGFTLCPACEERQAEGTTSIEPSASMPVPSSGAAPAPSPLSPKEAVQPPPTPNHAPVVEVPTASAPAAAEGDGGLGSMPVLTDSWQSTVEDCPVGSKFHGEVIRVLEDGVAIDLGDDTLGFAPFSPLGTAEGVDPVRSLRDGQSVDVRVLKLDSIQRRIILGVIAARNETILSPEISSPASPPRSLVPWLVLVSVLVGALWYGTTVPKGADRELQGLLSRGQMLEASRVALSPGRMEGYSNKTRERLATTASGWVQQRLESWMRESATPPLGWAAMAEVASVAQAAEPGVEAHNFRLHYVRGQSAFEAERYPEARQMFVLAQTAPDRSLRALAQNGLGKVCWRVRDVRCAVDAYRAAISSEPTWVFPYQNLAGVMMQERNYLEAERYYETTIRLTPNRASPHVGLGEVYIATRRYPQARRKFEEALRMLLPSDDPELGRSIRARLSWLAARGQ